MKLRTQLILLVCISTFILLSLTGGYLISSLREREMNRFRQKIAYNDNTIPLLIRIPLWNIDMGTVGASLGAIFTDTEIQRIVLTDPQGQVLVRNERPLGGAMELRSLEIRESTWLLGTVEIVYSTANIDAAIFQLVATYTLGGILILLISSGIIVLSVLSVTRPLGRITAILAQTGSGDFSSRLEIPAGGEIRVLMGAVNAMRDALEERERTIASVTMESVRNETKYLMEQEQRRQSEALRRELEQSLENLRKAQAQLINSEKMAVLGGLVAGVAHEINTPLGIGVTAASFLDELVHRFTEHMAAGPLSRSELEKFIQGVQESARLLRSNLSRAAELIRSFKQVSVDQTSEMRREFALNNYLNEVIHSLHPRLRHLALDIRIDCPKDLVINSFPGVFAQIITNLVINTVAHGFRGRDSGSIHISARMTGGCLELEYADDGVGMSEEGLRHLFEPFYTSLRNEGGSGLGTYTIYNLVTQVFGGTVRAESPAGKGLCYRFNLPIDQAGPDSGA
jgi:signal transduction histidine kinase